MSFGSIENRSVTEMQLFYPTTQSFPGDRFLWIQRTAYPPGSNYVTFTAPQTYYPSALVLLTFENVSYSTLPGQTQDLSQVKLLWHGETNSPVLVAGTAVSYAVTMLGGTTYTLNEANFAWPSNAVSSVTTSSLQTITSTTNTHQLSFTDFHNQAISLKVSPTNFFACVGGTNVFTASGAPTNLVYHWSASAGAIVTNTGAQNQFAYVVFGTPTNSAAITVTAATLTNTLVGLVGPTNVVTETAAVVPSDRTRKTIGVGEEVVLTLWPICSGTITWSVSGGGTLITTNGIAVVFTAPGQAASPTVTASYNGISYPVSFTVWEPTGVATTAFITTGSYPTNFAQASMQLRVFMAPTSVSFYRVQMGEVPGPATNIWGYFTAYPAANLAHTTAGHFWMLGQSNHWVDTCNTGSNWSPPWTDGGFRWDIPWRWFVAGGPTNLMPTWSQQFSIDAHGTMTIEKFGSSVSRKTNDVVTTNP